MHARNKLAAVTDLFRRYSKVWSYFWGERHQLRTGLLTADEADFLPAALAIQERPISPSARTLAWVLIFILFSSLTWAIFGRMDIVVNAMGKVIPSARVKTVASVDTASVASLYVIEGQEVKAGEKLVVLDTSANEAQREKALQDASEFMLQIARNEALLNAIRAGKPPAIQQIVDLVARYGSNAITSEALQTAAIHVLGQYRDFSAKLAQLDAEIASYAEELPLAKQQAESYKQLVITQDVARVDAQLKQQALVQLRGKLHTARQQRAALIAETERVALDEIALARRNREGSLKDAEHFFALNRLYTLKAPVDGTVQQLAVHTLGGVVPAAQPLMQIVPKDGPVEVEAFIENKDQGFIYPGQTAAVKIDTYEYTKYGTLPAFVTHVSQDAIEDEKRGLIYSVKVQLEKTSLDINGRAVHVTPGMAVNVEIKTGDRRIIEYVLSPLARYTHEALNER